MMMHKKFFILKDLATIHVGSLSASDYPKIKTSMPVFERTHTFQVAKSTLKALSVDTCLILKAMGALNCSTLYIYITIKFIIDVRHYYAAPMGRGYGLYQASGCCFRCPICCEGFMRVCLMRGC
jgi:hypothetical protein